MNFKKLSFCPGFFWSYLDRYNITVFIDINRISAGGAPPYLGRLYNVMYEPCAPPRRVENFIATARYQIQAARLQSIITAGRWYTAYQKKRWAPGLLP